MDPDVDEQIWNRIESELQSVECVSETVHVRWGSDGSGDSGGSGGSGWSKRSRIANVLAACIAVVVLVGGGLFALNGGSFRWNGSSSFGRHGSGTTASSKQPFQLVKASILISTSGKYAGGLQVMTGHYKGESLSPTALVYRYTLKKNGSTPVGPYQVKIVPKPSLKSLLKHTVGFNVFDPSALQKHSLGYGGGVGYEAYDLGFRKKTSATPTLAPSQSTLKTIEAHAMEATLVVTVHGKEVAKFDLSQFPTSVASQVTYTTDSLTGPEAAVKQAMLKNFAASFGDSNPSSIAGFKRRIYVGDEVNVGSGIFVPVDASIDEKSQKRIGVYYVWQDSHLKWQATGVGSFKDVADPNGGMNAFGSDLLNPPVTTELVNTINYPETDHAVAYVGSKTYGLSQLGNLPLWVIRLPHGTKITKIVGYDSQNRQAWTEHW